MLSQQLKLSLLFCFALFHLISAGTQCGQFQSNWGGCETWHASKSRAVVPTRTTTTSTTTTTTVTVAAAAALAAQTVTVTPTPVTTTTTVTSTTTDATSDVTAVTTTTTTSTDTVTSYTTTEYTDIGFKKRAAPTPYPEMRATAVPAMKQRTPQTLLQRRGSWPQSVLCHWTWTYHSCTTKLTRPARTATTTLSASTVTKTVVVDYDATLITTVATSVSTSVATASTTVSTADVIDEFP